MFDFGSARSIIIRYTVVEGRIAESLSQNLRLRTVTGETAAVMGDVEVVLQLGSLRLYLGILVAYIKDEFIHYLNLIRRYDLAYDR